MNAVVRLEDGGLARGTEAGDADRFGNDMAPLYTLPLALVNGRLAVGTDGGTVAAPYCLSLGDVLVHALFDVDGSLDAQAVALGGHPEGNPPWRHRYRTVCLLATSRSWRSVQSCSGHAGW